MRKEQMAAQREGICGGGPELGLAIRRTANQLFEQFSRQSDGLAEISR